MLQGIQYHAQFWSYMLLYGVALAVLLSTPRFRGKGWLMAFVVITLVAQPFYYLPVILDRFKLVSSSFSSSFFEAIYPVTRLLYVVGDGILVAFILELRSAMKGRQAVGKALFSFSGRVPRHVYWVALLTMLAINFRVCADLVDPTRNSSYSVTMSWITYLIWLPIAMWISLAVQIKRWHDLDKSGWWVLIGLVPIVGGFWVLIENGCIEGTKGPNRFGPNPNEAEPDIPDVRAFATSRL